MTKLKTTSRLAKPFGSLLNRNQAIDFEFDGQRISGFEGDTIASALLANGQWLMSRSFKYHRARAPLTLAGQDANTLVQLPDAPNTLADTYAAEDGLQVYSQNILGSLQRDRMAATGWFSRFLPVGFYYKAFYRPRGAWQWWAKWFRQRAGLGEINTKALPVARDKQYLFCDVLVIGGGAAGLQAALSAAKAGAEVILVEQAAYLGGSMAYQRASVTAEYESQQLETLLNQLKAQPNIRVLLNAVANSWQAEHWLGVVSETRLYKLRAKQTILASGVLEQPAIFRGNDIPGVVMGSAVQRMMKLYAVKPAQRAVVLAGNDEAYGVALDLIDAQVEVAAIIDLRTKVEESARYQAVTDLGIPIKVAYTLYEAKAKNNHLSAVDVRAISWQGQCVSQAEVIDCELLVMSVGFMPTYQLACQGGAQLKYRDEQAVFEISNLPQCMYLAGSVAGVWNLEVVKSHSRALGDFAARRALNQNALIPNVPDSDMLSLNHPWPIFAHPKGKEFVDFDEDLTIDDILNATKDGYDNIQLVKRYSTCGMGPSQGRQSALAAARLVANATKKTVSQTGVTTARPPFTSEPLGINAGRSFHPHRTTPMHQQHLALGAVIMQAGQWYRPAYYASDESRIQCVQNEALHVRNSVGVIDVSTLGGIDLRGSEVGRFLNRLYTSRFDQLKIGRSKYALLCNEAGVVIDDGVVCRLSENHFYLTATTGGVDRVFRTLLRWNVQWQMDVDVSNVTSAYCAVNLAGPKSREVLQQLTELDLSNDAFEYMAVRQAEVTGVTARIMRVGFVGELGYEIHVPNLYGSSLWQALIDAGQNFNIKPFGVEAQRLLRLEKGHVIIGQDTDAMTTPAELQMQWTLGKDKDDFIGQRTLQELAKQEQTRKLIGFVFDPANGVPAESQLLLEGDSICGRVTSVAASKSCGQGIGLAFAPKGLKIGEQINIKLTENKSLQARVAALPFYDPEQSAQGV